MGVEGGGSGLGRGGKEGQRGKGLDGVVGGEGTNGVGGGVKGNGVTHYMLSKRRI